MGIGRNNKFLEFEWDIKTSQQMGFNDCLYVIWNVFCTQAYGTISSMHDEG